MAHADIVSFGGTRACSGKCKTGACHGMPRVWLVAACEGMVSLLAKHPDGALSPILHESGGIFSSVEAFQKAIEAAESSHAFDQLVIVGSTTDIAWIHAALPTPAMHHIAAEIEYPLLPAWMREPMPLTHLTQAIAQVLSA